MSTGVTSAPAGGRQASTGGEAHQHRPNRPGSVHPARGVPPAPPARAARSAGIFRAPARTFTLSDMAKKPPAAALSAEDRQRLLDDLAAQQAQQRTEQVSALSNLYTQISSLRAKLAKTETTYRATHRQVTNAGLLSAAQLRTLGLPALAAAKPTASSAAVARVPALKTRNTHLADHPAAELPERPDIKPISGEANPDS